MSERESVRLLSIQVGSLEPLVIAGRQRVSGIVKRPVRGATIGELGLEGDAIADTKNHGGKDQAVYLYSAEDYTWWAEELGTRPEPGRFGENLILSSFGEREPMVGDRWKIGEVLLETTAPRIPCSTFGAVMADPGFPKQFRAARRPGFYARVLRPGVVSNGDAVEKIPSVGAVTISEMFDAAYITDGDPALWERLLEAPVAERVRADYERRLGRRREA